MIEAKSLKLPIKSYYNLLSMIKKIRKNLIYPLSHGGPRFSPFLVFGGFDYLRTRKWGKTTNYERNSTLVSMKRRVFWYSQIQISQERNNPRK